MENKDKLSLRTKLRLFWDVLTKSKYDPRDYKTIREQEAWEICEERRKEMKATHRPREPFPYDDPHLEQ